MAEPFIAEIRMVGFNFAPRGWATCDGQLLPINQNQALFSLLGTTYGGDGRTTFALPDLRGRIPVHIGTGFSLGQRGGSETQTLDVSQMPSHTHGLNALTSDAVTGTPTGNRPAYAEEEVFSAGGGMVNLSAGMVGHTGGSANHDNMQPYLSLNFVIALQGLFPSRS